MDRQYYILSAIDTAGMSRFMLFITILGALYGKPLIIMRRTIYT